MRAEYTDQVATVTLDRPQRLNAQDPAMWLALGDVASQLPGSVRVVVVRGAGRSFSAGLDRAAFAPAADGALPPLVALAAQPEDQALARVARFQRGFGWLADPSIVSVAAVQGHAIGAGFQLALACDLRLLTEDAEFTMAEASLGLVPDLGGTKRLVELVGYSRALEICLTGRRIPADEAVRCGLATSVVPAHELDAAVERTVATLLGPAREALIETKALLLAAAGRSQAEQERAEREAQYRRLRELARMFAED